MARPWPEDYFSCPDTKKLHSRDGSPLDEPTTRPILRTGWGEGGARERARHGTRGGHGRTIGPLRNMTSKPTPKVAHPRLNPSDLYSRLPLLRGRLHAGPRSRHPQSGLERQAPRRTLPRFQLIPRKFCEIMTRKVMDSLRWRENPNLSMRTWRF